MSTLNGFVVAGSVVVNVLAAGNHLNHFGMMTTAFASHHVGLAVSNLVVGDICSAHVAD